MKTGEPSFQKTPAPDAPTHEHIAARAHRLWIEAGRPEGRAREHWLEAERQLQIPAVSRNAAELTEAEKESDRRLDGLGPEPRDPRSPKEENL
jgi:hypothetical protein